MGRYSEPAKTTYDPHRASGCHLLTYIPLFGLWL